MIDSLSWKLARGIKSVNPDHPRSVEVLKHAISFLLNTGFIIGLSLIVSLFTGRLLEVTIALVSYAFLRQFSGGLHLKSGTLCVAVSTLGATIISFADFEQTTIIAMNSISICLALAFAPSQLELRIPKRRYPYLKVITIVIISSNFLFDSPVLALAFLVQSATLIKRGGDST